MEHTDLAISEPDQILDRRERLEELEYVIEAHLSGFMKVGRALLEVKKDKLYLETHRTFESWAKSKFKISRGRAYQYIAATETTDKLAKSCPKALPSSEFQVRPLTKLDDEELVEAWESALDHAGCDVVTSKHVKKAVRELKRKSQVSKLVEIERNNRDLSGIGPCSIMLADPPWGYNSGTTDPSRQIENQYPTMSLDDICDIDVKSILNEDALLYLWVPAPLLPEGLQVMKAWGFSYKTNMAWDKELFGPGYWWRVQHELLLLGVKGNMPKPPESIKERSVLRVKRTKHSKKPEEVYEMIERYYPELSKVELFAREERDGWESWGNEV